ncbi:hypothetical protein CR513_16262, partial [Mucuna pruriens]
MPAREPAQTQKRIQGPTPDLGESPSLRGLPANFKTLEFDKYKGSSCPRVHLAMYCRKMATYIYDDKVLIHCFQDNLIEAALSPGVGTHQDLARSRGSLLQAV